MVVISSLLIMFLLFIFLWLFFYCCYLMIVIYGMLYKCSHGMSNYALYVLGNALKKFSIESQRSKWDNTERLVLVTFIALRNLMQSSVF